MANDYTKKDGWRTKGNKQLRVSARLPFSGAKEIQRACELSMVLDAQGIHHEITITCSVPFELERAREAWAGFVSINGELRYLGVRVRLAA